jgi:ferritin-like metal-binding protein YciE
MDTLKDVFEHELKDLYSAESQLVKALPKMAKGALNDELRQAFENHLEETQTHVQRLEQVAQLCDVSLRGEKCKGMEGLIEEGSGLLSDEDKNEARDAALIPAAQRVEHYEMAAYGSAVTFANLLGLDEAAALLQQTLDEEKAPDAKLSEIAEQSVNPDAMANEAEEGKEPALAGVQGGKNGSTAKSSKASSARKS